MPTLTVVWKSTRWTSLSMAAHVLVDEQAVGTVRGNRNLATTMSVGEHVVRIVGQARRWVLDITDDADVTMIFSDRIDATPFKRPFDVLTARVRGRGATLREEHHPPSLAARRRAALRTLALAVTLPIAAMLVANAVMYALTGFDGPFWEHAADNVGFAVTLLVVLVLGRVVPLWAGVREDRKAT